MKNLAIKAENISKQYRLGEVGTGTLSHDLNRFWNKVRGKEDPYLKIGESNDRTRKGGGEYVWSLKDINFEIEQGDAIGIIGRNGAGKSTLLKLLSKVTKPTTGTFKVNGRIASLLEVGTGFNPEMTGRENIYMNGAILGMRRQEITRKFDEIVEFSGVGKYIDTPVKRYSSGMYVRLAFAVAAHLESEILIIDEVLAVGDAEFQKKCLGKMGDISKGEGRTVLFVSHNMAAIKSLCNKGLFLTNGQNLYGINPVDDVIANYLNSGSNKLSNVWEDNLVSTDGVLGLKRIAIEFRGNSEITSFSNAMPLELSFRYDVLKESKNNYRIVYSILTSDEIVLFSSGIMLNNLKNGSYVSSVTIPAFLLNRNTYKVFARIDIPLNAVYVEEQEFLKFEVVEIEKHSYGILFNNEPKGYLHIPFDVETILID